jgi:hypothetical protein
MFQGHYDAFILVFSVLLVFPKYRFSPILFLFFEMAWINSPLDSVLLPFFTLCTYC